MSWAGLDDGDAVMGRKTLQLITLPNALGTAKPRRAADQLKTAEDAEDAGVLSSHYGAAALGMEASAAASLS